MKDRSEAEGKGPRARKRAREALYGPPETGRLAREGRARLSLAHEHTLAFLGATLSLLDSSSSWETARKSLNMLTNPVAKIFGD